MAILNHFRNRKMIKFIPYSRQNVSQEDIDAVAEVLKSHYLTTGPCVPKFEKEIALKVNAKHAIATNSATSALHIACLALDLNEGDWLWTSPITFVASANCGLYCGASIDFVDINPKSGLMDVKLLEEKLEIFLEENKSILEGDPKSGNGLKEEQLIEKFKQLKQWTEIYKLFLINKGLDLQDCENDIFINYRGRWDKK